MGSILLHLVSLRDNCFEKETISLSKKNKGTIITPGVDYEKPNYSFLFVTNRFYDDSDSASNTITFAFKTTATVSKKKVCFRTPTINFAHFFLFVEHAFGFFANVHEIFHCFLASRRTFYVKTTHSFNVFFVRTRVIFLTKKKLGFKFYYLKQRSPFSIVKLCKLV